MAFESPGWANSGGSATYTAEQTRRAVFAAYARTASNSPGIISGGLLGGADLSLAAPGSGMSVNIATGECIVGGSEGGAQGGYYAKNNATVNLAIAAANPSNPRIDTVCVTISDNNYTEPTGGSGNQVAAQVVTGTPTSGATLSNLSGAATLPLSSLLLGYVLVPAAASNIVTADISNRATVVSFLATPNSPQWIVTPTTREFVQVGVATKSLASGWSGYSVTFGTTFPNSCAGVWYTIHPASTTTITSSELAAQPAANGFTVDINSSTSQSADIYYWAVGF